MRPAQQDDKTGNARHAESALTRIEWARHFRLQHELCNEAVQRDQLA